MEELLEQQTKRKATLDREKKQLLSEINENEKERLEKNIKSSEYQLRNITRQIDDLKEYQKLKQTSLTEIGSGGGSTVYSDGKNAIKVIYVDPEDTIYPMIRDITNEVYIMKNIQHPNIMPGDVIFIKHTCFLTMPLAK